MANGVKWIHITADVFDNWKIRHLKAMPEIGHALVCIWFELLCLAGKCNHPSGFIVMSEKFIISDEMIADMFNEDIKLVKMALDTFEKLGMIQVTNSNAIQINNWFEYQNEAGLAQIRQYESNRKAEYRAKKELLIEENKCPGQVSDKSVDPSLSYSLSISNSLSNSINKEKDKNKDTKKNSNKYIYYPNDEKLNQTFLDYIDMRKKIKAPMTDRAITLAMNTLTKLAGNDNDKAIAILEQSIMNSWKGLFELKDSVYSSRTNNQQSQLERILNA